MSTVFSKIIAGIIPGNFLWADETCVAISTIAPITPGHTMVIPRTEFPQYIETPDEVLAQLAVVAKRVGQAQCRAFGAPRAALLVAGFEVPHTHLHVLPAWDEAALSFSNARHAPAEEIASNAQRVRAELVALGFGSNVPASIDSPTLA